AKGRFVVVGQHSRFPRPRSVRGTAVNSRGTGRTSFKARSEIELTDRGVRTTKRRIAAFSRTTAVVAVAKPGTAPLRQLRNPAQGEIECGTVTAECGCFGRSTRGVK